MRSEANGRWKMEGVVTRTSNVVCAAIGFVILAVGPSRGAQGASDDVTADLRGPEEVVAEFAGAFLAEQKSSGALGLKAAVQGHLKAEIALVVAGDALGDRALVDAAGRDLRWLVASRLEPGGGVSWSGPNGPYFFEVHQHWFLIASELLRRRLAGADSLQELQSSAWRYLRGENPSGREGMSL